MTHVIKRGDLLPDMTVAVVDGGGGIVDLSAATEIRAVAVRRGLVVFDRVVTGDASGSVVVEFESGDTDVIGYMDVQLVVTWQTGKEQTFPAEGSYRVRVALDGGV